MPKRTELPYLDELLDMFDEARNGGYASDVDYETGLSMFKNDLLTNPSKIREIIFNKENFRKGGAVRHVRLTPALLNSGLGLLFKEAM